MFTGTGALRESATCWITALTFHSSAPSNHSRKSLTVAPLSRFSKSAATGSLVPVNTQAPLTLPGKLSTTGHLLQSVMLSPHFRWRGLFHAAPACAVQLWNSRHAQQHVRVDRARHLTPFFEPLLTETVLGGVGHHALASWLRLLVSCGRPLSCPRIGNCCRRLSVTMVEMSGPAVPW